MPKPDQKLKVFISYARKDGSAFAEELVEALDVAGFDAFLDRNDIAAGEAWEARLEAAIAAADTLVFVVTPGAVASERCGWEAVTAQSLSKRIIPVVALEVAEAETPAWLGRLNYIFFNRQRSFSRSLKQLAMALATDEVWIREHTRIAELANRWIQHGRPDVLLLRGPELEAAERWVAAGGGDAPQPTDLQRSFIAASADFEHSEARIELERLGAVGREQAAKEEALQRLSRRTTLGLIGSGVLAVAAAGFAFWSVNAEGRFRVARQEAEEAEKRSVDAQIAGEAKRTDIAGQLIAFATSPSDVRLGAVARSTFTGAAIAAMTTPDTSIVAAFAAAQSAMRSEARLARPLLSTSLNGDIYLGRPGGGRVLKALVVVSGAAAADSSTPALRDGDDWAGMLAGAGFEVSRLNNPSSRQFATGLTGFLGREGMGSAMPAETRILPSAATAPVAGPEANALYFFVFVGDCANQGGATYLGFSDSSGADDASFRTTTANLNDVAAAFAARAAASVLVIDAGFALFTGSASNKKSS